MRRPVKWRRILAVLADGRPMTRFDAADIGDTVLPATVHQIEAATGIHVDRMMVTVPGWAGCPARVACYWLSPENRKRALAFLGGDA